MSVKNACVSAKILCSLGISNIKNYNPEPGEKIIIAADNDGIESKTNQVIEKAARSLEEKGAYTAIITPDTKGDFNDLKQNLDKEKFAEKMDSLFASASKDLVAKV